MAVFILVAICILLGLAMAATGFFELYKRFYKKERFSSIGMGVLFSLIGMAFTVTGIYSIWAIPAAKEREANFIEECEARGGTFLEVEDNGDPWNCWSNRIEIEGY